MEPIPFKGISMKPLLREGDFVLIEKEGSAFFKKDIVLFKDPSNGEFVVHRVINRDPLLTKGDWSIKTENLKDNDVFAKVIGFQRDDKVYHFKNGLALNLYFLLTNLLQSSIRPIRQVIRVLLHFLVPFLYSRYS